MRLADAASCELLKAAGSWQEQAATSAQPLGDSRGTDIAVLLPADIVARLRRALAELRGRHPDMSWYNKWRRSGTTVTTEMESPRRVIRLCGASLGDAWNRWWWLNDGAPPCRGERLLRHSAAEHIMGMPAQQTSPRRWTEAEFYSARESAPPGERWELVDGEVLVTPSPHWSHQRIVGAIYALIRAYVREQGVGEAFVSPLDVKLEPGIVLQPDALVVPSGELVRHSDIVQRLLLAVEVGSPGSARHDRVTKRPRYQRNRVPEYWIIDPVSQTIERWRPDDDRPELVAERLVWTPQGATAPFELDIVQFFAEVAPEP